MRTLSHIRTAITLVALVAATTGCSGLGNLGALGDILGAAGAPSGSQQGQLSAEIQRVDPRQQVIHVRTQDGRSGAVRYDRSTQVLYRRQQYPVTALERGDIVVLQIQQDARGNLYTGRVDVQQSVQERTGQRSSGTDQLQQLTGRIRQIDHDRGLLQLQTQYSGTVTVALPYNASRATVRRFNRLRRGDSIRLEGIAVGNGRVELRRFL